MNKEDISDMIEGILDANFSEKVGCPNVYFSCPFCGVNSETIPSRYDTLEIIEHCSWCVWLIAKKNKQYIIK